MNILILVESFAINKHSSAIGRSKFINALSEHNKVSVLYPNKATIHDLNPEPTWLNEIRLKKFYLSNSNIFQNIFNCLPKVRALPTYINGLSMDFNRLISDWKKNIEIELSKNNYDLIIVLGTGSSFAPHFAMSELNIKIKWIANIHDPYPMSNYPEPYKKKDTLLYIKQAKKIDKVFKKATWVTFPSLRLKEWMVQFHDNLEKKSFILPHLGQPVNNLPDSLNDQNITLENGKFNLLHAGSLLGPRNPKYLIKAFLRFIEEDNERKEKSILSIIGKIAPEHISFDKEYENVKNNIKIIKTRVSYKHSLVLLKQADVLVLLEAISKESPFMPGKLADYIYADKPILALTPKVSETSRLLGSNYPFITQTDNEDEIYNILIKLWEKWKAEHNLFLDRKDLKDYISAENIENTLKKRINVYNS